MGLRRVRRASQQNCLSALAHVSHGNKKREPLQKEIGKKKLVISP